MSLNVLPAYRNHVQSSAAMVIRGCKPVGVARDHRYKSVIKDYIAVPAAKN